MNRRNVLISIATVALVTGAVLGSGALTSVEADRNLNIETADDSAAYIQMQPVSPLVGTTSVGTANGQTILDINLDQLNDEANTTLAPAFNITNQVGEDVTVSVSGLPTGVSMDSGGTNLASGVTVTNGATIDVDMTIDTTSSVTTGSTTITIEAVTN